MVKIRSYIIRLLFMLILPFTALREALIKNIFVIVIFEGAITLGTWLK